MVDSVVVALLAAQVAELVDIPLIGLSAARRAVEQIADSGGERAAICAAVAVPKVKVRDDDGGLLEIDVAQSGALVVEELEVELGGSIVELVVAEVLAVLERLAPVFQFAEVVAPDGVLLGLHVRYPPQF